jgi:Xaa-Pro aminopeptidase
MADYAARIAAVRAEMAQRGIGLLFLPVSSTLEYLTGIPREEGSPTEHNRPGDWAGGMYLGLTGGPVVVEPRMGSDRMAAQVAGRPWIADLRVLGEPDDYSVALVNTVRELRGGTGDIALGERTWAKTCIDMLRAAPDARLVNAHDFLYPMRYVKDDEELAVMRRAARLTDEVYEEILPNMRYGMSERDIAWEVDRAIHRRSPQGTSFNTGIRIGGGKMRREGSIHESLTDKVLEPGSVLAFDFGMLLEGYCSDFGRTVFFGEPTDEQRQVYDLVIAAQESAIAAMRDGQISAEGLDRVARAMIEHAGYGPQFIHRLGHAIGKDVHEPPFLLEGDDTVLRTGMCFTIEPSVLMHDGVFIRVEDVVMVTPNGGENFNATGHVLRVIDG